MKNEDAFKGTNFGLFLVGYLDLISAVLGIVVLGLLLPLLN